MRVEVDNESEMAYVYLQEDTPVSRTQEFTESILFDYDESGSLVGIEFLDATAFEVRGR